MYAHKTQNQSPITARHLLGMLCLLMCLYNASAQAGSTSQAEERVATVGMRNDTFFFQDSCHGLLEVDPEQLALVFANEDLTLFERFCAPEEEMTCIDYDQYVQDWGYLKVANTPGFCRFVPIGSN